MPHRSPSASNHGHSLTSPQGHAGRDATKRPAATAPTGSQQCPEPLLDKNHKEEQKNPPTNIAFMEDLELLAWRTDGDAEPSCAGSSTRGLGSQGQVWGQAANPSTGGLRLLLRPAALSPGTVGCLCFVLPFPRLPSPAAPHPCKRCPALRCEPEHHIPRGPPQLWGLPQHQPDFYHLETTTLSRVLLSPSLSPTPLRFFPPVSSQSPNESISSVQGRCLNPNASFFAHNARERQPRGALLVSCPAEILISL